MLTAPPLEVLELVPWWQEIGQTLGIAEHASADDKSALTGALADSRRLILEHQLRRTN